jgi:hypothetical protein
MNRIVVAVVLAVVAVAAGAVWALGQFGGPSVAVVSEPREPLVRGPEITIAAVDPAQVAPPAVAPGPATKPKTTTKPAVTPAPAAKVEPKVDPTSATPDPVVTPDVDTPAATPTPAAPAATKTAEQKAKDALNAALGKAGIPTTIPKAPTSLGPTTLAPPTPSPEAPASTPAAPAETPAAPAAAPEPTVTVQNAPTPTQPNARSAAPAAAAATEPGVTQVAAPVGLEAQFKSRRVTYNRPPEKLALNKAVDVSLVINATEDEAAGREALQGFKGEIVERDVELSDTVSAQLTGAGFDIVTQTIERQRLSGRTVNRWQWRVTPTEEGEHTLMLEIFGYASGSLDAEPLDAYRDVIAVEVEQLDQLVNWAKGVQPLFAVLAAMAGIGSAIFAFLRFREEKKQTKAVTAKGE